MTTINPHMQAARAEVVGRLAAYREARAGLHADILRAAQLGMTQADIARQSGLSVHGVRKILRRHAGDPTVGCVGRASIARN